ncbi:hypothetical protein [Caldiplasma sukawensis]
MKTIEGWVYFSIVVAIILFGAGMYYTGYVQNAPTAVNSNSQYNLTMVITNQNYMSSVNHDQPAYFVLENGKIMSSAQIYLPANSLIKVTIINYDTGPGTVPSQYAKVMGTLNNTEYVINDTSVNKNGTYGQWVNTVPEADLAHTFTVPGLGLNIMVPSVSTVIAYFHTGSPGVYQWQCQVNCGTGPSGWGGAMATSGWMQGEVIIQ